MRITNDDVYKIRWVYNLSVRQMAHKLGYSQSYISKVERGIENITDNVKYQLIKAFELDTQKMAEIKAIYKKFNLSK